MIDRMITTSRWKRVTTAAALASLASLALLPVGPAVAKGRLSTCEVKHSQCTERCLMKSDTEKQGDDCIKRTCEKQNPGCGPKGGGDGPGKLSLPPKRPPPRALGTAILPAGGLLDAQPGFSSQSPAAPGSLLLVPAAPPPPAPPPVVIR
jgi:hypothetical protein